MVIKARNTSGHLVEIEEYSFQSLSNKTNQTEMKTSEKVSNYNFKQINENEVINKDELNKEIKLERHYAKESSFVIDPRVYFHRGLKKQQEEEINHQIKQEVREKLKKIEKKAYIKGTDEGKRDAYQETKALLYEEASKKVDIFEDFIKSVINQKEDILKDQIQELYQMIKILVKWIILRELKEDGEYINRLLEKLILELGSRENLLIKVNENRFAEMPVMLELLQKKIGDFKNVRIERNSDQEAPGIIVESMNTILDGTFLEQMKNFDKLFLGVLTNE